MNALADKLYFASPLWMQNLAVSVYGAQLRRQRRSSHGRRRLLELRVSERFNREQLHRLQEQRFLDLVALALREVPFYRRWAVANHVRPEDFCCLDDIRRLPVIGKEQVREDPGSFVVEARRYARGIFELSTSGTTGTPLTIFCDRDSRAEHYAFFARLRGWFGVGSGDWRATFLGRIIVAPSDKSGPFWRYDLPQRNVLFSSYHLSEPLLPYYVDKLSQLAPAEVFGYPSSLAAVAGFSIRLGAHLPRPKLVMTTAETLLPHQRELIEAAFGAPVVDQYGCTEMAFFCSQCESGTMHVHPEHGVVEVLDAGGEPCAHGMAGRLIATGFVNRTMLLLRYDVGDTIVMAPSGSCGCGRAFPVVKEVVGRTDDLLYAPDGRPLGRLDPILKGRSGICETQIEQVAPNRVIIRVVPDASFDERCRDEIAYEFRKRAGSDMAVEVHTVTEIRRSPTGKFKAVMNSMQ